MQVSLNQLTEIFSEAFEQPVVLSKSTIRTDLEKWDSLNHLNLIIELEDKLNVSFTPDEIEKINSIENIINILAIK